MISELIFDNYSEKNMKKIFTILIFLLSTVIAFCQQEPHYTQFMYNKLAMNPGYAGSHEGACFTGVYRNQWIGLEGAPKTAMLSFDMPLLNERVGIGLNVNRNTIGISERWTVDGIYAYRIPIGKGHLGVGIQASVRYLGNNYADSTIGSNTRYFLRTEGYPSAHKANISPILEQVCISAPTNFTLVFLLRDFWIIILILTAFPVP